MNLFFKIQPTCFLHDPAEIFNRRVAFQLELHPLGAEVHRAGGGDDRDVDHAVDGFFGGT